MIIGFTGHQKIDPPDRWDWVRASFGSILQEVVNPGDRVLTSLAGGGDQVFSEVALAAGLAIEVVVPCADYGKAFKEPTGRAKFEQLLAAAARVIELDYPGPSEDAFLAAGQRVVDLARLVVALWDGKAAGGKGGTGDIVAYARERMRPVVQVDPNSMRVLMPEPRPDHR